MAAQKEVSVHSPNQLQFSFMRELNLQCYNRLQTQYFKSFYSTLPQIKPPYTSFIQLTLIKDLAERFHKQHAFQYFGDDFAIVHDNN
jgi:hypothetical protein